MTTKPIRPYEASTVAADRRPIAATLTIPDFSWQVAPISLPLGHRAGRHATGFDAGTDSSPNASGISQGSVDAPHAAKADAVTAIEPNRTPQRLPAVQRLQRWRRYWVPVGGGVAVILLWLCSVLMDRSPREPAPGVETHRQARRESSTSMKPAGKSRLRTRAPSAADTSAATAATRPSPPASTEQPAGLAGDNTTPISTSETAAGVVEPAPASAEPDLAPPLNPPTGSRVAGEVQSVPATGPATAALQTTAQGTTTSSSPIGAPQTAPDPLRPQSTEPGANRAANHGAAGSTPVGATAATPTMEMQSMPSLSAADQTAPGSPEVQYQHTNPTTYKDPVYEVPPMARQPKRSDRQ